MALKEFMFLLARRAQGVFSPDGFTVIARCIPV